MASMQLTDGNPDIADLSDQNRPDKLAERFSELYDNEWTDCYQVLVDDIQRPEEESIQILLHIVQTSYHICLERSQEVTTTAKEILFAFAGRSDTEPDKALDALIQETLHTLKSFRTKNFKATPADIEKVPNKHHNKSCIAQEGFLNLWHIFLFKKANTRYSMIREG
ncbi:hypothetical protein CHS0354_026306 [Potamilus streckersoni]|uniref:Mitochondria-eating protein C-terminal domain-containing protein n=1 Tax=Potamilus streckersoni TaxID=2493646 RepID=A0AAE0TC04_9BIVA|nr:hypothetical protein CHS0354_026306 [Potamilus streckersoni]